MPIAHELTGSQAGEHSAAVAGESLAAHGGRAPTTPTGRRPRLGTAGRDEDRKRGARKAAVTATNPHKCQKFAFGAFTAPLFCSDLLTRLAPTSPSADQSPRVPAPAGPLPKLPFITSHSDAQNAQTFICVQYLGKGKSRRKIVLFIDHNVCYDCSSGALAATDLDT